MSGRCNVSIQLDRSDRTYRGGETVSGTVEIRADQELRANHIQVIRSWKTHGRGNVNVGGVEKIQVAEATVLSEGQTLKFPFSFSIPEWPVTYHGTLVSVDHYVRAEVDVSWARNPQTEEDFLVLPGARPPQLTGERTQVVTLKEERPATSAGPVAKVVLTVILIVLLVALSVAVLVLVPVFLIVGGYFWIKKQALKRRVGDVEVLMPHRIVAPGEPFPLTVRFTARKSFPINEISVVIEATETAVSGSGTDKTTHRHQIARDAHLIRHAETLSAGDTIDEHVHVTLPSCEAFSFESSDNSVRWTAEVRIDIPRFPDWVQTEPLQMVPAEFLSATTPSHQQTNSSARRQANTADSESRVPEESPHDPAALLRRPDPTTSIMALIDQLNAVSRHSPQRDEIVRASAGRPMSVSITIERIASTTGMMTIDSELEDGQTILGQIDGTRQSIQVYATPDQNPLLEKLTSGSSWQTHIEVLSWDSLYNRITAKLAR